MIAEKQQVSHHPVDFQSTHQTPHLTLPFLDLILMQIIDLIQELYQYELLQRVYVGNNVVWDKSIPQNTHITRKLLSLEHVSRDSLGQTLSGISRNSQQVAFGDVFVCIQGATFD